MEILHLVTKYDSPKYTNIQNAHALITSKYIKQNWNYDMLEILSKISTEDFSTFFATTDYISDQNLIVVTRAF